MKFTELEYMIDDHTQLVGVVALDVHDSMVFQSFNVIVYINSIDHDLTAGFEEKWIDHFKDSFEMWAKESKRDELTEDYSDNVG